MDEVKKIVRYKLSKLLSSENYAKVTDEDIEFICNVISSHMGAWNKDFDGNEVLPIPKNKYQNFVHMCDYLASRKVIKLDFDENNNIVE